MLVDIRISFLSIENHTVNMKMKIWYDCQLDYSPQETKMTQKLTTIGHWMAFNNEHSLYRIVIYKRPQNDDVKQFKRIP